MATMVKEKRREKKKSREKPISRGNLEQQQSVVLEESDNTKIIESQSQVTHNLMETSTGVPQEISQSLTQSVDSSSNAAKSLETNNSPVVLENIPSCILNENNLDSKIVSTEEENKTTVSISHSDTQLAKAIQHGELDISNIGSSFKDLNTRLERIQIPNVDPNFNIEEMESKLEHMQTFENTANEQTSHDERVRGAREDNITSKEMLENIEDVTPSAPIFEEPEDLHVSQHTEEAKEATPKIKCMPLEEAIRIFGGREMAEVRSMSEREEAIVEAGPMSGPEHPLVDLLSTFRSSLIAVERERTQLAKGYTEEEKFRNTLWKIEKRNIRVSEDCPCGAIVDVRATYEHAELLKDKLPVAKLKLESLLRDVQDSYCHHQHAALLAHCQIEDLISETVKSSKKEIREALALVLRALRMSDTAPGALATALQRWAAALGAALLDGRDPRQLLHLLHHMFRQTRSVRWAARIIRGHVTALDRVSAARALAVLDLLLSRPGLDAALECVEEAESGWEEVDERGGGGAVGGGLRERDLLALLHALPRRQLVATIVGLTHTDLQQARESSSGWGSPSAVAVSACGVRALLWAAGRGAARAHYARLQAELRALAAHALHALANLHTNTRHAYTPDLEAKLSAELEAAFAAGVELFNGRDLHQLPATLLTDRSARDYCDAVIQGLHEKSSIPIDSLSISLPPLPCATRVALVAQAAFDRAHDNELAQLVMDFLMQTGIKKQPACAGGCGAAARGVLPRLLRAHAYLHTLALHALPDLHQAEALEPSSLEPLAVESWRPTPGEAAAVLADWGRRGGTLLPPLLMRVDCAPPSGVSLESQLTIGSWLCQFVGGAPPPEWAWSVLRTLRVHRTAWRAHLDAPPPETEPGDLLSSAFAVLSSSWGHSVPLICSSGVSALCSLAESRPADAIHCLAPVMLVMAHSPESISLTPKFGELFATILKSGPTMVQRALGLGPVSGADHLLRLALAQVEDNNPVVPRAWLLSAWLHALWRPGGAPALLEAVVLAARDWPLYDGHANYLLKEPNATEYINQAVSHAHTAPLCCEVVLRAAHGSELRALWPRLLDVLHLQRVNGDRIHVDNAITLLGVTMSAELLVIYRTATAVLAAPLPHPAHLLLWRLLFHLYLQRPPSNPLDTTPPVGPLFFSGIKKSMLLAKLRKKLQDTITHHKTEALSLKQNTPKKEQPPQRPSRNKIEKRDTAPDDGVLPMLTVRDLTGESSESSESESSESETEREVSEKEEGEASSSSKDDENEHLLRYHTAAENMCSDYLKWLDEGDKVRAMPLHTDIARFIPEQALAAAWAREASRRRPAPPAPPPAPARPTAPPRDPASPYDATVARLRRIRERLPRRSRRESIKSSIESLDPSDARALVFLVDKHLADIEALAQEWSTEVTRIASLDSALWELVAVWRVRRPLPPVKKSCVHKCKPVTIHIPHEEWCISTGAERGIKENRRSATALVRRVCRPRPHAARTAAALATLARNVRSREAAVRVCSRAWRCARAECGCAPAAAALTALVDLLAERWICTDGKACSELLSRWSQGGSELQQELCGALVRPPRAPASADSWVASYSTLLEAKLAPHAIFSYLSKFEVKTLATTLDPAQRRQLLEALAAAAQRWGPTPDAEYHVLLELIGVHTAALLTPQELSAHVLLCTEASTAGALPPAHWTHVTRAVGTLAAGVPFDQLGHLLRSLGVSWWTARTSTRCPCCAPPPPAYAPHVAGLLHAVQRAFVAAAVALSYAPERVAVYAWSALQESWSPWVSPLSAAPPLLPSSDDYTTMLRHFVDNIHQIMLDCPGVVVAAPPLLPSSDDCTTMLRHFVDNIHQIMLDKSMKYDSNIHQIMLDCPGTEDVLLQQIFTWCVQTYLSGRGAGGAGALLAALYALPWGEWQWWGHDNLDAALQVCANNDRELESWCSSTWRHIAAETWLRGATDDQLAPLLAKLLHLFTAMLQHSQTLEQCGRLPWARLPGAALEPALDRFFERYHSAAQPYHELPQFRVLLFASELLPLPGTGASLSTPSSHKRGAAVSSWVRAASHPALLAHVAPHTTALLNTLTELAPYLEGSAGEIEDLLSRAVIILCVEPAAAAALPVWQQWVTSTTPRMVRASLSAAGVLTAFEYFAALADSAARAQLRVKESDGWQSVLSRWQTCPWRGGSLGGCARARLHAAYALAVDGQADLEGMRLALLALHSASINFVENEAIVAVWICLCCRLARSAGSAGGASETAAAARGLLARWAAEPRRSLLQMVTLQADSNTPTPQHRLLCRLAQCIVSNSEAAIRAYESSCAPLFNSDPEVLGWGKAPRPSHLVKLAVRLYPTAELYFKLERGFVSDA